MSDNAVAKIEPEIIEGELIPAASSFDPLEERPDPLEGLRGPTLLELCVEAGANVWSEKAKGNTEFNTYITLDYEQLLDVMARWRSQQLTESIIEHAFAMGNIEIIDLTEEEALKARRPKKDELDDLDNITPTSVSELTRIVAGYEKGTNPEHRALIDVDDGSESEVPNNPKVNSDEPGKKTTPSITGPSGNSSGGGGEILAGGDERTIWEDYYDGMCGF